MTDQREVKTGMAEDEFDDTFDEPCWQCCGEGYIADCFDGLCVNAEDGCELCMKRCDICNRA